MRVSLKAARVNANLTQRDVGIALGCSKDVIKAIEKGTREIRLTEFRKLCELYRCTGDDLILPYDIAKSEKL